MFDISPIRYRIQLFDKVTHLLQRIAYRLYNCFNAISQITTKFQNENLQKLLVLGEEKRPECCRKQKIFAIFLPLLDELIKFNQRRICLCFAYAMSIPILSIHIRFGSARLLQIKGKNTYTYTCKRI